MSGSRSSARPFETGFLRFYRHLLWLYPSEFRNEYRRELCLAFVDQWRAEPSSLGLIGVWFHSVFGILRQAPKEHYHMILHDLRYAVRVLRKDWSVTAAAIVVLALGIGATTVIFSLANGLLLRPLPYPQADRLVSVEEDSPKDATEVNHINFLNYLDLRARSQLLKDIGVYAAGSVPIRGEGPAELVEVGQMSDGVFPVLGVEPLLGRYFNRADDLPNGPKEILIGEGLWQRRYGRDPGIIGRALGVGDSRWTVIGVMPANFHFPRRAEVWLPLQIDPAKARRTDYGLRGIARLKAGVSISAAHSELESLLEQIHRENPTVNNGWFIRTKPIREEMAGTYRQAVITLLVAVGLLLLISCANVSNLLLIKASTRVREMAVRTALGASRTRLVRQLFSESLILGLAGAALGILLSLIGIPALTSLIPIDLPLWMDFSIDHRVLGFSVGICLLTILTFGVAPAVGSSRVDLSNSLKEGGRASSAGFRQKLLRNGLVIGEVALSVTLLAGAGLMIHSFLALRLQNLGFRPENILTLSIDYPDARYPDGPAARSLVQRLEQEVAAIRGVASAAFTTGIPLDDGWSRLFTIEGHPVPLQEMTSVNHIVIAPGYFRTLGVPLLQGRDFTDSDYDQPLIVIVSASFAQKYWPGESALGKRIRFGPPANNESWHTVVGVVADYKHGEFRGPDRSNVYLPYQKNIIPSSLLIRTSVDPATIVQAVRSRISTFDKDIAVGQTLTLDQIIDRISWQDRFLTVIMGVFAALALALSAVGLYAIISYTVSLSTHEIGIRMALGASAARVRSMILRQGMLLAGTGLLLGISVAMGLARLLKSQLYQVSPLDPATYIAVPVALLAIATFAAFLPTRRATSVDPVLALRHE